MSNNRYALTLAEMIAAVGIPPKRVDYPLADEGLLLDDDGPYTTEGLYLIGGDRDRSVAEVRSAIEPQGHRLEGLVRGLAFLKGLKDQGLLESTLNEGPIAFPATVWPKQANPLQFIPVAGIGGGLFLAKLLYRPEQPWSRLCRFLASYGE